MMDLFGYEPPKRLQQLLIEEVGQKAIAKTAIPAFLTANLNPTFELRPYQKEAFQFFLQYWEAEGFAARPSSNPQVLYHMATGSGKTMIMAGLILYLYQQGYRNFLFFVNSSSIIEKTRDNFLNPGSSKYLFNPRGVQFGQRAVPIQQVETFAAAHPECINISFTTIQGLHLRLNNPSENSITYEDFEGERIVLLSDEAHHINALTKKGMKFDQLKPEEQVEILGWEQTVRRIHQSHPANALLEFTATIDLADANISAKYTDKLLFDYSLKRFRQDGFSKEIKVLQADMAPMDRALIALILSQYRRKVFAHHRLAIKPVVLLKSKTIAESKAFYEQFKQLIQNLEGDRLEGIKEGAAQLGSMQLKLFGEGPGRALHDAFEWFSAHGITMENLALELREDFGPDKCLTVNSKEDSIDKQLAVNSLEDSENEYRAIFAVDMLNEGWDVLNLFDIVRLYDTQSGKGTAPSKTTMSEAQLIGRGARYCPFAITADQDLRRRKYDSNVLDNPLRICEELYYHSAHNPNYITELNTALQHLGLRDKQMKEKSLRLKESFKASTLYKAGFVFSNKRIDTSGLKLSQDDCKLPAAVLNTRYKVSLLTGSLRQSTILSEEVKAHVGGTAFKAINYSLADCPLPVRLKAMHRLPFYHFRTLSFYQRGIQSAMDFANGKGYLPEVKLELTAAPDKNNADKISPDEWLEICTRILEQIQPAIEGAHNQFKGTREFHPEFICRIFDDKTVSFAAITGEDQEFGLSQTYESDVRRYRLDISKLDWYAYEDNFGTSEEKSLVKYFDKVYEKLKQSWDQLYLIRNEQVVKLYTFDSGQKFYPDFILFLSRNDGKEQKHYQIFIEPKGRHLLAADSWKEQFLLSLKEEGQLEQLYPGQKYNIWGLPFYNESERLGEFEAAMQSFYE